MSVPGVFTIEPNDCEKEREDRHGRVHVSTRRTWVVNCDGEFWAEYHTLREAKRAVKLNSQAITESLT